MTPKTLFADVFTRIRAELGVVDHQTGMAMQWAVPCPGHSRDHLGDEAFELEHHRRRAWCKMECPHRHYIHGLYDEDGRLVGRVFRFASDVDAVRFKLTFC